MKFNRIPQNEEGSVTVWHVCTMFILLTVSITLFEIFQIIYYRHAVDSAVEAAALSGASNVVETTDYINNTASLALNKGKADKEASWLYLDNIKKNGLDKAIVLKDFTTKVETDAENRQWYKCKVTVSMKVELIHKFDFYYVSISKGEYNKKVIEK